MNAKEHYSRAESYYGMARDQEHRQSYDYAKLSLAKATYHATMAVAAAQMDAVRLTSRSRHQ